jgi:membrane-bound metal-dependent hydrolase YbcI (DUF457 family)
VDPITHPMAGALIGAALATRRRLLWPMTLTAVLAAVLPDADVPVLRVIYLLHHAGYPHYSDLFFRYHHVYTHSLFEAPVLAIIAAVPAWLWVKSDYPRLYLAGLLSAVVHVGLDWPFDYKLQPFVPLSNFSNEQSTFLKLPPGSYTYVPALAVISLLAVVVLYFRSNQKDPGPKPGGGDGA